MTKSNRLQRFSDSGSANDECREDLEDVIGQQLIPRLLNAHNYIERLANSGLQPRAGKQSLNSTTLRKPVGSAIQCA